MSTNLEKALIQLGCIKTTDTNVGIGSTTFFVTNPIKFFDPNSARIFGSIFSATIIEGVSIFDNDFPLFSKISITNFEIISISCALCLR